MGYEENRLGWHVRDHSGKYHFSRDVTFNETTPGHLSPAGGISTNNALLSPPSQTLNIHHSSMPLTSSTTPHITHTPLPAPSLADVVHNRDLMIRSTRSHTNSLPKPHRHYNDIDIINLSISLNTAHDITSDSLPDPSTLHTELFHECLLSAPLPFLRNRSWDITKPPNSYHEAINRPDNSIWLAAKRT